MEMRLAPILILYYFPAEFSRHLYDNAKKIFPSPEKNPSGVAATPRPRIILPPPRSITLASLPNRAHLPPSPSIVSPLEYASSVSRVDLVSPPPPPPQFSSPHHQSPKQMTRSRRRYPPRHRSSPRLSDIRIFLSMPAPSHTLPRISPCSSTTLDLRRSQISTQNVERSKIYEWRARHRERERERLFCSSEEFITIPRFLSMDICLLLSTPLPQEFDKPRFVITRYRFSVSGLRPSVRPFRDLRTRSSEKSDEKFRRRRDFFPRETIPPTIIRPIGVALILCAIKRFINRADKFGNNRGRGRCLRVTSMRGRSISGNRVDRLLAVKGDGARRIGSCSAATPVGTQRQR